MIAVYFTFLFASSNPAIARICFEREGQNGSLNSETTELTIRRAGSRHVEARKAFTDAGTFCVNLPHARYTLTIRFTEPWRGTAPARWWSRSWPIDARRGSPRYVITNPAYNEEFQAMIAGPKGWHRLWPVERVR